MPSRVIARFVGTLQILRESDTDKMEKVWCKYQHSNPIRAGKWLHPFHLTHFETPPKSSPPMCMLRP